VQLESVRVAVCCGGSLSSFLLVNIHEEVGSAG
jgi:hypothetical protein